jgi:protease YdgD
MVAAFGVVVVDAFAGDLQPGIFGNDDRQLIELVAPWPAIGQINVTGYRHSQRCTGSLIASDLVVTAAHCVMDTKRRKPFPLHQIHFLGGVKGSDWMGHSTAKCLHFSPDYEFEGRRSVSHDVVFIVLKDKLTNIAPLEIYRAKAQYSDFALIHASYPADRRYALTGHFGCRLLKEEGELWFTDCDTHAASSGGPVLIETTQGLKLAAIMVGIVKNSASIAVTANSWNDASAKHDCP